MTANWARRWATDIRGGLGKEGDDRRGFTGSVSAHHINGSTRRAFMPSPTLQSATMGIAGSCVAERARDH
jgi:hypothetical protein